MDGAKDIVALSIPFAAGVAAAAAMPPGETCLYWTAAAACTAAGAMLCLSCGRGGRILAIMGTYFALGVLCWCSAALGGGTGRKCPDLAARALTALTGLIDSAGFRGDETSALLKALLTGQRKALSTATADAFRASGASHILALSGLHLGVIYGVLTKVLSILGNSRAGSAARSVITVAAAGFYVLMTGASPSIVRAFLFIAMNEWSRHSPGRRRRPVAVLCAALTVQLAISPATISSLGFQLSYLAMLGIFLVFPQLEGWYPPGRKGDPMRMIWNSLALSLSCQIFTAPLVWWHFRTFPKYFLLTNLIALPVTEVLITSSAAVLALNAAGICPSFAVSAVDRLADALIFCLKIIAEM